MKIDILTLFPGMLKPMLAESILGRAIAAGLLDVRLTDIRDFTADRHRRVDDYPFGGGAGMVMAAQPIADAIAACDPDHRARRIYLSPRGRTLDQRIVEELAREERLLLLCGHYEGVDQRALDLCVDEELSIGDYVLTGGELGALVVVDAVARLVPGVLGSAESGEDESFTTGLLEYPQYTRPAEFRGLRVPDVLLGGNHAGITAWRRERSLDLTRARRPDLLDAAPLTGEDRALLERMSCADRAIAALAAHGVAARRADMADADAFPRRWFAAFVPEENRKGGEARLFLRAAAHRLALAGIRDGLCPARRQKRGARAAGSASERTAPRLSGRRSRAARARQWPDPRRRRRARSLSADGRQPDADLRAGGTCRRRTVLSEEKSLKPHGRWARRAKTIRRRRRKGMLPRLSTKSRTPTAAQRGDGLTFHPFRMASGAPPRRGCAALPGRARSSARTLRPRRFARRAPRPAAALSGRKFFKI